jgi:hypothetical protein
VDFELAKLSLWRFQVVLLLMLSPPHVIEKLLVKALLLCPIFLSVPVAAVVEKAHHCSHAPRNTGGRDKIAACQQSEREGAKKNAEESAYAYAAGEL